MIEAIKINADGTVDDVELNCYADYSAHLEGYIEAVTLRFGTLWVNEEFLLGQFSISDFNSIASDLCGLGGRSDLMLSGILGPALLTGHADRLGETLPVSSEGYAALGRILADR